MKEIQINHPSNKRFKDITGQRFHYWTVQEFKGMEKGRTLWLCLCDCGETKLVNGCNLRMGNSMSCGCFRVETQQKRLTTHGESKGSKQTSEYKVWTDMKGRCNNPKHKFFSYYGGRGITICKRWMIFENFLIDMGRRPSNKHSIDRKDNSNGYDPCNCRWATKIEQQRNMRNNRLLTLNGDTFCVTEWSERLGLKEGIIRGRLNKGWNDKLTLTTPISFRRLHK